MIGAVFALLVAVDPLGIARTWPRRLQAVAIGAAVLLAATALADPVLDVLDISPEGFWIAAGIVLLVPALSRLLRGTTNDVAGPAAVLVAMALAMRDGVGDTLVAVAITVLVTAFATRLMDPQARWLSVAERVVGASMVVVAFDLIRDGVIAV